MNTSGLISIAILLVTFLVSSKGFKDTAFYSRYNFVVDNILLYKDYKRILTSGFLHVNWMHLIFNMITLYFFSGAIQSILGALAFLVIYLVGIVGGNLLSLLIHKNAGDYSAVGSSGGVNAIIFATIALVPGMTILFFIPAWLFGIIYVGYSIYAIRSHSDNVGHDAHLGGGIAGMLVAILFQPSAFADNYLPILLISVPAIVFIYIIATRPGFLLVDSFFYKKNHQYSADHQYNYERKQKQDELDELLDKINRRGIKSLSAKEKQRLKELSK